MASDDIQLQKKIEEYKKDPLCLLSAFPTPRQRKAQKTIRKSTFESVIVLIIIRSRQVSRVVHITKKTGIDKQTVLTTVEAFMDAVKDSLSNDENVYLRGFGSFVVKKRAQKTARNISKNTTIIIPEHNIPAFKPAKTFTISVKK